ncbi:MAG TPA: hypothetical protein VJH65_02965 [Candidatus Nanoarchaeia archaeon]|nr:hypothetical protein [Candidatus Nanoarchaeia archaeon]
MKSLKPSMRENKRYLFVKGSGDKDLNKDIVKAVLDFSGVLGMSKTGMSFIKSGKDWIIVCVNREAVDFVRASLCVWPDKMTVEKVSGTLKGLRGKK